MGRIETYHEISAIHTHSIRCQFFRHVFYDVVVAPGFGGDVKAPEFFEQRSLGTPAVVPRNVTERQCRVVATEAVDIGIIAGNAVTAPGPRNAFQRATFHFGNLKRHEHILFLRYRHNIG